MEAVSPLFPIVNTRSPTTETDENPWPTSSLFQSSVGPSLGQVFSSPLSGEMLSRLGPRNWGQSAAPARAAEPHSRAITKKRVIEQSSKGRVRGEDSRLVGKRCQAASDRNLS